MEKQTGGGFPDSSKRAVWEDTQKRLKRGFARCYLDWWAEQVSRVLVLGKGWEQFKFTCLYDFCVWFSNTISTVCRNNDCFQTSFHIIWPSLSLISLLWQISCLVKHRWHTSTSKSTWNTIHNVWLWSDIFLRLKK